MTEMTVRGLAEGLARVAHCDQTDLSGNPYVWHLQRVAKAVEAMGGTDDQIAAAWLHDIMEDQGFGRQGLLANGITWSVVQIVEVMTHLGGEDYRQYVQRVASVPEARLVKLADSMDNLSRSWDLPMSDDRRKYQERYGVNIRDLYKAMVAP
jgi:(p)ppGpp synthase/HD superfamily hydrolase